MSWSRRTNLHGWKNNIDDPCELCRHELHRIAQPITTGIKPLKIVPLTQERVEGLCNMVLQYKWTPDDYAHQPTAVYQPDTKFISSKPKPKKGVWQEEDTYDFWRWFNDYKQTKP
jgi:hypothetical protein